ncbi:phosphoribosyltransferase family protein [Streptomyces sp. NPDC002851]
MLFTDRVDAGQRLAEAVRHLQEEKPVVLGLPRGGVPVAFEVARALEAPLDVIVVRKLGVPYQPELGFGAIGEGGVRVLSEDIVRHAGLEPMQIAAVEHEEERELLRRARRYRDGRSRIPIGGRTVIIVDDGIATGATASAACQVARAQGAARVVLAVPTAPPDTVHRLREAADEVVALSTPHLFSSVGEWYRDFTQTSDEEVIGLLAQAADVRPVKRAAPVAAEVEVDADGLRLAGDLAVPEGAEAVVMFAHGSGSSRHSPRNRSVATVLRDAGLGTLLFDLLTPAEEIDRANVFDIDTLSRRLLGATRWLRERESLPIGYFGASTGAAAALRAAADATDEAAVGAVVSRGGRPDLAAPRLGDVRAPTLLIVGGNDSVVLDLNRSAQAELRCENRLEVVPRATHLFEEPGALDHVADLARDWFLGHLTSDGDRLDTGDPGTQEQSHWRRALPPYATAHGRGAAWHTTTR